MAMASTTRWERIRRPPLKDVLGCLCLGALDLAMFWDTGSSSHPFAVVLFAVAGYVALAWRTIAPIAVLAIVLLHVQVAATLIPEYVPTLSVLLALYTVSLTMSRAWSLPALAASVLALWPAVVQEGETASPADRTDAVLLSLLAYSLIAMTAWAVGQFERSRRRYVAEVSLRHRAEQQAAMATERNRIAGELHDIVGHAVTVIILHAAGAKQQAATRPEAVEESLELIETAGRQAMRELRVMLALLLTDDEKGEGSSDGELHRVDEVDTLVEVMRLAGLTVEYEERGVRRALEPSSSHTAYRIVQEALTNVAKHVGLTAHVHVVLDWSASVLRIVVQDDGAAHDDAGPLALRGGHGLLALRERVSAVNGQLDVRIDREGGSLVEALLPISAVGARGRSAV